jgi:hypothetical protein
MHEDESDPHPDDTYQDSWAALIDRFLYGLGWIIAIVFVSYTCLALIGMPSEDAFKLSIRIIKYAGIPVMLYAVRN